MMTNCFDRRFLDDIKEHKLTIIESTENFKCFKMAKPDGSVCQSFTVIYAVGRAIITGDMGHYVFGNLIDPYNFFLANYPDLSFDYVSEKVLAQDNYNCVKKYNGEKAEDIIKETLDDYVLPLDPDDSLSVYEEIMYSLDRVDFDSEFDVTQWLYSLNGEAADIFCDVNISDFTEYSRNFVWCVQAIVWATREFDKAVNDAN